MLDHLVKKKKKKELEIYQDASKSGGAQPWTSGVRVDILGPTQLPYFEMGNLRH